MSTTAKGLFIISLDFELLWGVRDKRTIDTYGENIRGVRNVIPALLDMFDRFNVHATFATVGFLFASTKEKLMHFLPKTLPDYRQQKYSPYEMGYLNSIGQSEQEDVYHYGQSLIQMIMQHPKHEIASHTFSHFYCLENASLQSFEEDMKAAKKIAASLGIELKSVVFPRNQYSDQHVEVIERLGFISYRGNENSYIYRPRNNEDQNKTIKALRLLDSYINLTGHHCFDLPTIHKDILNIPASRFLRPFSPPLKYINGMRLRRIKNSLTYAALTNKCYHLWWHPHNFGKNLNENLECLEDILKHYRQLSEEYGIESKSMREVAEEANVLYGK